MVGVAKLIFDYDYPVNVGPIWLLNVDYPLQLVLMSM